MDNILLSCQIDAISQLSKELKSTYRMLDKRLTLLTEKKSDLEHLLNPKISHLSASSIAEIVSDYRKVLAERSDIKTQMQLIDKVIGVKISEASCQSNLKLKNKIYQVKVATEYFDKYQNSIHGKIKIGGKRYKGYLPHK